MGYGERLFDFELVIFLRIFFMIEGKINNNIRKCLVYERDKVFFVMLSNVLLN